MTEEKVPEFNSSLAYLDRISWLIKACHLAKSQSYDDVTDDFTAIDSLSIELDPRMNDVERVTNEELRLKCRRVMNKDNLRAWFVFLNRLAHAKGLIMKDASTMPGVTRD